jgi:hypothetical protein
MMASAAVRGLFFCLMFALTALSIPAQPSVPLRPAVPLEPIAAILDAFRS